LTTLISRSYSNRIYLWGIHKTSGSEQCSSTSPLWITASPCLNLYNTCKLQLPYYT